MDRVFVLAKSGQPLMPTQRFGKVRRMLKDGRAKVVSHEPFKIQLQYEATAYLQPVTLGIDAGYETIGYAAITDKEELIGGEVRLLQRMSERLKQRAMYRRGRRIRKRHRPARFDFRTKGHAGWLAPSIQQKLDSHRRLIERIKAIVPVTQTIIEVAAFDIQALKTPGIAGVAYQQGEQAGYWNLREYILHRDGHKCQNLDCRNKAKQPVLEVHHLGYWRGDRSDRPANLITLCTHCHVPKNHQPGGFLYGWQPKVKSFRAETFMSTVRWRLVEGEATFATYGYLTKSVRIAQGLEKSHHNDAFVIAGGRDQKQAEATNWEQIRRHNRKMEKFYDAVYIDLRTGEKAKGAELHSGRRTRNRDLRGENLRQYRARKLKQGYRSIRKQRYPLQPGDIVEFEGKKLMVNGTHCLGTRVILYLPDGQKKSVSTKKVRPVWRRRGLTIVPREGA
jgi:hypothetical protein